MKQRKSEEYVIDMMNEIWRESREYKAHCLGYAQGFYQFYKYYKDENGAESANKSFKSILESTEQCGEYFRKLVELDAPTDVDMNQLQADKTCL
jgi:hypothetical protein